MGSLVVGEEMKGLDQCDEIDLAPHQNSARKARVKIKPAGLDADGLSLKEADQNSAGR
jgi:hypothetical protein